MQNTHHSRSPFTGICRWSNSGGWRWHVGALAAGWLVLFVSPAKASGSKTSLQTVLLGGVLLLVGLLCLAPLLGLLQPVFRALGLLSGVELLLLMFLLLNLNRYIVGRKVLRRTLVLDDANSISKGVEQ